jgi:hypothetical protein
MKRWVSVAVGWMQLSNSPVAGLLLVARGLGPRKGGLIRIRRVVMAPDEDTMMLMIKMVYEYQGSRAKGRRSCHYCLIALLRLVTPVDPP